MMNLHTYYTCIINEYGRASMRACVRAYLSQALSIQLAMIHRLSMNTSSIVPGQIVISVFSTNLVLNVIRFSAPMLRDVVSLEVGCGGGVEGCGVG